MLWVCLGEREIRRNRPSPALKHQAAEIKCRSHFARNSLHAEVAAKDIIVVVCVCAHHADQVCCKLLALGDNVVQPHRHECDCVWCMTWSGENHRDGEELGASTYRLREKPPGCGASLLKAGASANKSKWPTASCMVSA